MGKLQFDLFEIVRGGQGNIRRADVRRLAAEGADSGDLASVNFVATAAGFVFSINVLLDARDLSGPEFIEKAMRALDGKTISIIGLPPDDRVPATPSEER